jgi:hypothetical protein
MLIDGIWQAVGPTPGGAGFWQRANLGPDGFALFPVTSSDDVVVGPSGAPTSKLFQDGDAVFGGSAMVGTERVRIVGDLRLEGGIVGDGGAISGDWGVGNDLNVTNDLDVGGDGDITGRLDVGTDADIVNDLGVGNELAVAGQTILGGAAPVGAEQLRVVGDSRLEGELDLIGANDLNIVGGDFTIGAGPNGKWFNNGNMAVGGSVMSGGGEKLRVVGKGRIEGNLEVTGIIDPIALVLIEQVSAPGAPPPATEGILWMDSADDHIKWTNSAATFDLTGAGSSPWTLAAGVIYPTTGTDDVAIGDTAMLGNERLLVINKDPAGGNVVAVRGAIDTDDSTVTVNSWFGFQASAQVETTDTLTFARHYEVTIPAGSGTIGTAWGLYINDLQSGPGTVSASYGIWQDGTTDLNVLQGPTSIATSSMSGAEKLRVSGDLRVDANGQLLVADSVTDAPLNITERSAAPSGPAAQDVYLDDGTNTASGNPGWRRYTGAVWEDIGGTVGSSLWTDGGALLYPTGNETLAIGTTAMVGSEQLRVRSADTSGIPAAILAELDTGGSLTSWDGLQVLADINAGHTVGSNRGVFLDTPIGTGTVTTAYGVQIDDQGRNSTTAYGVYIADQTATTAYGIFQAGSTDLNNFAGFMELGQDLVLNEQSDHVSTPAAGTGILWVKDDANTTLWFTDSAGADFQLGVGGGASPWTTTGGSPTTIHPSGDVDDDTVAIGVNAMSGLGEMLRIVCDPDEGEDIGVLAQDTDLDFIGGTWAGFVAQGLSSIGSSGTFTGFQVRPPVAGFGGYTNVGFHVADMTGSTMLGMTGFLQSGASEVNQFNGSSGFGGGPSSTIAVRAHTKSSGISAFFSNFMAYRNVDNTGTGPGPDWVAYDSWIVQPNVAPPHFIGDVFYYRVQAPLSSQAVTIRNAYGLYIADHQADLDFTYTNNPYGVYQVGAGDRNYFAGNVGIGVLPNATRALKVTGDGEFLAGQYGFGGAPSTGSTIDAIAAFSASEVDIAAVEGRILVSSGTAERDAGVRGTSQVATGTSGLTNLYGVHGEAESLGTSTPANLIGVDGDARATGSGLVAQATSFEGRVILSSSGNVAAAHGLLVRQPSISLGGTIATAYGLRIEGQTVTGVSTGFGVWQDSDSDRNFFNGRVGIGAGTSGITTSVALDAGGATGGLGAFMVPRLTAAQINPGLTAQNGMIVYNTTTNEFNFYENGAWVSGSGLA